MKTPNQKKDASPRLLTNGSEDQPAHDDIALRAYSLWEQQARPQYHEVAIWLEAEDELRQSQKLHGFRA